MSIQYVRHYFLALFTITSLIGCTLSARHAPTNWPTSEWQVATPESQGIDSETLNAMLDAIEKKSLPIHSLLVIRNGYLVLDYYFYPYRGDSLHDWASVTKSITATLVGIAIQQGHIKSVDQSLAEFYPEYIHQAMRADLKHITLRHLLTMSSGLKCGVKPGEQELIAMQQSTHFIEYALQLPMKSAPGKEFTYCSVGTHLLVSVIKRATGQSPLEYAQQHLFFPLGITQVSWPSDPQGIQHGWGDLRMHPRDMAKLGYLYMNDGIWQGKRILSRGWVDNATQSQAYANEEADYGYGWWVRKGAYAGIYEALGRGGQSISVWPEHNLIVVLNGAGFDRGDIASYLLASVKSKASLPENNTALALLRTKANSFLFPGAPQAQKPLSPLREKISANTYTLASNLLNLDMMALRFDHSDSALLQFLRAGQPTEVRVGLDGRDRVSSPTSLPSTIAAKGEWLNSNEFLLHYIEANGYGAYEVKFVFENGGLQLTIDDLTRNLPTQKITGQKVDHAPL